MEISSVALLSPACFGNLLNNYQLLMESVEINVFNYHAANNPIHRHKRLKQLSCLFIRSQASCLLARMGHLGKGANECTARRRVAMAEEERMRKEGEAFYGSHIRGRGRWRGS